MRVDTKKFLFIGMHDEKDPFFERAQALGVIQFVDMHERKFYEASSEMEAIGHAIKVLRGLPPVEQEEMDEFALADGLAYKINTLKDQLDKLHEEYRILSLEIARVSPFGAFSLADVKAIEEQSGRTIQFYCAKPSLDNVPDQAIEVAHDQGLDYYIAVNEKPSQFDNMIEMQIDETVDELKRRREIVDRDIDEVEERLKKYAKYHTFLHKAYAYKLDSYNLKTNQHFADSKMDGELFVVEGWVPVTRIEAMEELVERMHVVADEVAAAEQEVAPTCLENEGFHRIGEDLVHIYDTPSNEDKDPSMWVLVWFSLFFAMIIGDAGYGLLFLGTAFYIRYKMGEMKPVGKRVWKLLVVLSVTCIGWGLLTNSFFGIDFTPDSAFRDNSILSWLAKKKIAYHIEHGTTGYKEAITKYPQLEGSTDPSYFLMEGTRERDGQLIFELADSTANGIMMELALLFGIIHVCLGFIRYLGYNYSGIGWVIAIIGAWLYIPVYLDVPSILNYVVGIPADLAEKDGLYLMGGGFVLALSLAIYQNKLLGIFEMATVIQILADILSYLRLYALGLAGGIVSATVNNFAYQAGPILAIFPILIGHTINILLSIMGGIIHGLRLNFVEWYHYCFLGGGKRYTPLKRMAEES